MTHTSRVELFLLICSLISSAMSRSDPSIATCDGNGVAFFASKQFAYTVVFFLNKMLYNTSLYLNYGNVSLGDYPDNVYAFYHCQGYLPRTSCHRCVNDASLDLIDACGNYSTRYLANKNCFIFYSNKTISSKLEMQTYYSVYGVRQVMNPFNSKQILTQFLRKLINMVLSNSTMFAVNEVEINSTNKWYSSGQCVPTVTKSDCKSCLNSTLFEILENSESAARERGHVVKGSCSLRYGLTKFYSTSRAQPRSSNRSSKNKGAASAIIIIIVVIVCYVMRKVKRSTLMACLNKDKRNNQDIEAFLRSQGPLAGKRYSFQDVKKMTNMFREKLGQGGYGSVYKGQLIDQAGCAVAVKVLNASKGDNAEEFINEVSSISRTSHVNIVKLLGFCLEGSKKALIYEFMPHGSLEKFLRDGKDGSKLHPPLGWDKLYCIAALGVARGLDYPHRGCNTRIVHLDIKPHNILLDEEHLPKISDFGLAKLCKTKQSIVSMVEARGTIGYIAPEVFNRNYGGVSHKSDVYSYGMMLLEIVGGKNGGFYMDNDTEERSSEKYFPDWIYRQLEREKFELLDADGLMASVEET